MYVCMANVFGPLGANFTTATLLFHLLSQMQPVLPHHLLNPCKETLLVQPFRIFLLSIVDNNEEQANKFWKLSCASALSAVAKLLLISCPGFIGQLGHDDQICLVVLWNWNSCVLHKIRGQDFDSVLHQVSAPRKSKILAVWVEWTAFVCLFLFLVLFLFLICASGFVYTIFFFQNLSWCISLPLRSLFRNNKPSILKTHRTTGYTFASSHHPDKLTGTLW